MVAHISIRPSFITVYLTQRSSPAAIKSWLGSGAKKKSLNIRQLSLMLLLHNMDPVESGAGDDGLVLQELKPSKGVDQDRPIPGSDPSKAEEGDVESNNASRSNGPQDIERPEYRRGWRRMIRNFTPSWFSVNMGTGITSILLLNFPYNARWLQYISYVIFALNVFSFILFFLLSSLRYTLWPKIWVAMIRHPAQSLFLGCFPMGLGTIVSMICYVCVPSWSGDWWKLAWALWWIQSILSVAICLGTPFIM